MVFKTQETRHSSSQNINSFLEKRIVLVQNANENGEKDGEQSSVAAIARKRG